MTRNIMNGWTGILSTGMDFETWKNRVEKKSVFGIIKADKTVSGHSGTPKMAEAGMVIDHIGKDGKVDVKLLKESRN